MCECVSHFLEYTPPSGLKRVIHPRTHDLFMDYDYIYLFQKVVVVLYKDLAGVEAFTRVKSNRYI